MQKKEHAITFLGKDTEFEGKLRFNGILKIDGHLKGEISADGNLIVGEEGVIEADIHVSNIVVSGEIHGNISADQRVDILSPGKVFGNIQAPNVVIGEGVIFEGKTRMYQAKDMDQKKLIQGAGNHTNGAPPILTTIYGIIADEDTKHPIKNARIRCKGVGKKNTNTNMSGYFELINLDEGTWKIKIKARGYRKKITKIAISGEGISEQNFRLKPK